MQRSFLFISCLFITVATKAQKPRQMLIDAGLKGPVKEVVEYEYRSEGNKDVDTTHSPFKTITKFNQDGKEIESITYNTNGSINYRIEVDNTNPGIIVKSEFTPIGELLQRTIFSYNVFGNKIKTEYMVPDIERLRLHGATVIENYVLDEKGNEIEADIINEDTNKKWQRLTTYNEKGLKVKVEDKNYGEQSSYTYDNSDRVVESKIVYTNGQSPELSSTKYGESDGYGNWLQLSTETKGYTKWQGNYTFYDIKKRRITYYN